MDNQAFTASSSTTSRSSPRESKQARTWRRSTIASSVPGDEASSSSAQQPLRDFLLRNLEHKGSYRILFPFLTATDLLRLSECSMVMRRFRAQLSHLKMGLSRVSPFDSEASLNKLLGEQETGIEHVSVVDPAMVTMLFLHNNWGRLKTLSICKRRLGDKYGDYLCRALREGNLQALEELELKCSNSALVHVMATLTEGACPRLRHLVLSSTHHDDPYLHHVEGQGGEEGGGVGQALADALRSGYCSCMQTLDLYSTTINLRPIMEALRSDTSPTTIRDLKLSLTSPDEGRELGITLRTGRMRRLEVLTVFPCGRDDEGLLLVLEALEAGACPELLCLDLPYARVGPFLTRVLDHALTSGSLGHLQQLNLEAAFGDREATLHLLEAIKQPRACPNLRRLKLIHAWMDQEHGQLLATALESRVLPQLDELILSNNALMAEEGVVAVMNALAAAKGGGSGGCYPPLRRLELVGIPITAAAGVVLGQALPSSGLQYLNLTGAFDTATSSLPTIKAINQRGLPAVRHLILSAIQMEVVHGWILAKALRKGHCRTLEKLSLSNNKSLGDEGVMHVAEALEAGECPWLQDLDLNDVGMGLQGANALGSAMVAGSLARLERLTMGEDYMIGDEAMHEIVMPLSLGLCPHLRELSAFATGMGKRSGSALLETLKGGSTNCPILEKLHVADSCLGDWFAGELAQVMVKTGVGSRLRSLELQCSALMSFPLLAGALERGALPVLDLLSVWLIHREAQGAQDFREYVRLKTSLRGRVQLKTYSVFTH